MSDTTPRALTPAVLRSWGLPTEAGSKYDRGTVLVVGGAAGTPGAAMLAGISALRVGAGRLTLAVAEGVAAAVAVAVPESGVVPLPQSTDGTVLGSGAGRLEAEASSSDVVVVGPGLDDADETAELLRGLVPLLGDSTVLALDAYALGVLPGLGDLLDPLRGRIVLTPNPTEAGLLLGADPGDDSGSDGSEDEPDVAEQAASIARRYSAVVSCQGIVGDPDGGLWEGTTGTSGLATSGSGDVLVGAIAGIAARSVPLDQAACWGTHLHAVSGDRLAASVGTVGYLARELADQLPHALAELST
ncbi:ADP-dependent NAD(P)H-hydrate dehydratase [Sanguibacter inulinus]|uniref:ADP-dependent (S)-NAD(P)H-hydrate dehydratase n=1 Tax=Sanguibacter inulinus TaxID=60922 RepID=A0A853EXC2_9MICO|nr:ADP/ATP-dependent (S)-NAD(P)H-hydrate dehydratase [Sanguibacter inulinus]MBF0724100.1 NAD(P)H-hydrate dehydratase [Sanguibacter inulinus]NYS95245.1 NAD(P)H-hydrate dehydratase [Sanguibacter inulinus]